MLFVRYFITGARAAPEARAHFDSMSCTLFCRTWRRHLYTFDVICEFDTQWNTGDTRAVTS
jgi:hypothetical protein